MSTTARLLTPEKSTPEPILSFIEINYITESSAHISWDTDEPATTILKFGVNTITDSVTDTVFVYSHEVILSNLNHSTSYQIRAEAVDVDSLRGYGRDSSFTTEARMILWFPNVSVGVGDTVNVPIQLVGATNLAALQYALNFGSGAVEIVSLNEGSFLLKQRWICLL